MPRIKEEEDNDLGQQEWPRKKLRIKGRKEKNKG